MVISHSYVSLPEAIFLVGATLEMVSDIQDQRSSKPAVRRQARLDQQLLGAFEIPHLDGRLHILW